MANGRLQEFQRNTSFVAFMLVVCFAGFVYLTQRLSGMLTPLGWSAFFAVPLTALVSHINKATIWCCTFVLRRLCGFRVPEGSESVQFKGRVGKNRITVERTPAAVSLFQRVNSFPPCWTKCATCCRRRVRIAALTVDAPVHKNCLVENRAYYVQDCSSAILECTSDATQAEAMEMQLFIDEAGRYPAVLEGVPSIPLHSSESVDASDTSRGPALEGTLEVDKTSILSWTFSIFMAMSVVMTGLWVFITFIALGAEDFNSNVGAYQSGINDFLENASGSLQKWLGNEVWSGLQKQVQDFAYSTLPNIASEALTLVESIGFQAIMFIVYTLFWVCEPLPISSSVATVFKSYLLLKTFVCFLYATLMSVLLLWLQCPLWHLFFVLTFVLNYIPEFGAIISAALMVPAVMLNGSLSIEERQANTLLLVAFGSLFKILTGNLIEVQMYATKGGQFMRMHPVVLIAMIMLCEVLLGVTGMFLAIPMLAAVKYYMISADMPEVLLDPLLTFIEGDEAAPHRNFVDWHRRNASVIEEDCEADLGEQADLVV